MPKKLALIIGVGAINGLGAALCRRAATADYHVAAAGRTAAKIDKVAAAIEENGGKASAHVADVTDEPAMIELFDAVDALDGELEHDLKQPGGMVTVKIDPETGLLASTDNQSAIFETFRADRLPPATGFRATGSELPGQGQQPAEIPEQLF